jgi:CheY-specific phosphatase CheX
VTAGLVVDEEVVASIVEQVWESLFDTGAPPWYAELPALTDRVAAEVRLRGDWNGSVRVSCEPATAEWIARTMLALAGDDSLPDDDVHDALGEVVNVVGGNVKGTLGGETSLGLPVVRPFQFDGREPVSRRVVDWLGRPVVVEVFDVEPLPHE